MSRKCEFSGKTRRVVNLVSHSNIKTKTVQLPNLRTKRLWLESEKRFVRVRLAARALKTVTQKGLDRFLSEAKLTLRDVT